MHHDNLFAYGTLMCPDILEMVIGEWHSGVSALLSGYGRFRVSGEHYPGVIPIAGAVVRGTLYTGISPKSRKNLDIFEGDLYIRTTVRVLSPNSGTFPAFTYVIRPEFRSCLTSDVWRPDYLTSDRHRAFVSRYAGFGRTVG